ncbi:MAG TPA: isochorismate synthase [Mycobacteriales bacterium]|nr:isochorismate synthase [Mycobacteriales bacterium]
MTVVPTSALGTVRTVPIPNPGDLLDLLPEPGGLAWVTGGEGLIGWGTAARLELTGPDPFAAAEAWWRELLAGVVVEDEVGLPGCGPVAFGSFAFDGATGTSALVVPETVVGVRDGVWWLTTVAGTGRALPVPGTPPPAPGPVTYGEGSRTAAEWTGAVAEAIRRIDRGEVEKVVLARDVVARAEGPVDPRRLLRRLAAGYPGCWTFAVDGLLGATPEMLVRLEKGIATSRVLAGTLPRTAGGSAALARSAKDLSEHRYGVASVADALARHCGSVEVPDAPYVLALPNVLHLATDVSAVVADGSTSLGLLASLHPSAAVCGSPRPAALAVIRAVEGLDRGRYAGPVGWMNAAGDGEWGIALRCAELDPADPARLRLFAGCGIVAGSDPAEELAESEAKLLPMREALGA